MFVRSGILAASILLSVTSCAAPSLEDAQRHVMPLGQTSFAQYAADAKAWIGANRSFVLDTDEGRKMELEANLPKEYRPEHSDGRGILLVHGLGDSPWSFSDIAQSLAANGILVRTVLLPGCGTQPADMMPATADDWRRVVQEQADILSREVDEMWLGGYSTGCNLVLDYADANPGRTKGFVLFSPAVEVRPPFAWAASFVSNFRDWLVTPESRPNGGRNPFQYFVVPMKGFVAFHDTMVRADDVLERLEKKPWSGPAAVMLAEHDGLVETEDLLARFDRAFPNPRTRIFWYGEERFARGLSAHVRILPEVVPEKRIASFSHMSMTYRPDNPMYGESGAERLCWNGQSKAESKACEEGAEIWYSGERHQPGDGRNCAKLTFNPWYDEQLAGILDMMAR